MIDVPGTEYIHHMPTGNYQITKKVNGVQFSFGTYSTLDEAKKWRDYFQESNWKLTERLHYSKSKHIMKLSSGKYKVIKQKNNTLINYGIFDTLPEAEYQVKLCKTFNWDSRLKPFDFMKYIQKRKVKEGYHYRIVKPISHDDVEYYGTFNTLEDAQFERDLLVLCDWDYENVVTLFNEGDSWLEGKLNTTIQFYRPPNGRIDYMRRKSK